MDNNIDDLKHIRSMMERSSKFFSLSGLSGISAGLIAALGAMLAYFVIEGEFSITDNLLFDLGIIATTVIACAGGAGLFFSLRKAKKLKSSFWVPATRQIAKDFGVPMMVGGMFCIILVYNGCTHMVAASMLIFYGLALIYAGARTYRDIKILGVCEIILGFLAGIFVYNGLLFWALGFGVLHIIYGIVMHFKYDRSNRNN